MAMKEPIIRDVRPDDDFEHIRHLILETKRSVYRDKRMNYATAEVLRNKYFPEQPDRVENAHRGYVAEEDGRITAFMGVFPRQENGIIEYGVKEDDWHLLGGLLDRCSTHIADQGGTQLLYFATMQFAQIRNREISAFEQLGFVSEEYARLSTHLSLNYWKEPEQIDSEHVVAETELGLNDIYRVMLEDDEPAKADVFKNQYYTEEPSNVILTLRSSTDEIMAIAYYKVKKVNPRRDELSATAFNLHFRPKFELARNKKKQFLQAVLSSMKQLNLSSANTSISLQDGETFTLLVQEGFHDFLACILLLTKTLR